MSVQEQELLARLTGGQSPSKQLLLDNPDLFIVHYFPHRIQRLEDFHLELIEVATGAELGLALFPAAHGKTTIISTLLPIWAVCRDPNTLIAVIGKNEDEAKDKIARAVMSELQENDELIRDFGPFRPTDGSKPWSLRALSVEKRTRRAKEPTIAFFGAGSKNVLGHRVKWVVCDDVVTPDNSASEEQRAGLRQWFDLSVSTMAEKEGDRLTVVGTLFHPKDLYHDLIEMKDAETGEPIYTVIRKDAIVDEDEHTTLWPEQWPWRRLMGLKGRLGTLEFNKRLRNIAVDASRMVFKEEYVKGGYSTITRQRYPGCLDEGYTVGEYDETWRRYSGFDPAVGTGRSAKFCAHLTLAVGTCAAHERCFWIVDLHRDQMTLPQQVDLILEEHQRYGLLSSVIEANSYQGGLYQAIEQKMNERGLALHVEPHHTTRSNKHDPEIGLAKLSPWVENGKVHIPWGNQESRRKMQQLVDELVQYPGRTTDTVMAFWFAWIAAEEQAPAYPSYNRLRQQAPGWNRMLGRRVVQNPFYERPELADHA